MHFLSVIRNDDELVTSSFVDSNGLDTLSCPGYSRSKPQLLPLRAVSASPLLDVELLSTGAAPDESSGVMRPRLLAVAMAHHPRLGAGDPRTGRRCWLRDIDVNVQTMIAHQSCSVGAYAAALAEWIFPEPRVRIVRAGEDSEPAGLHTAEGRDPTKPDAGGRSWVASSVSRPVAFSGLASSAEQGFAPQADEQGCGKRRR